MFADLLRRLTTTHEPIAPLDQRIALAALLVRVARSDGDFGDAEADRIDKILSRRYGLNPFEAVKLRADAETLEAEAPDTVRFTRAIKDAVPYEDREAVIEALWSVALADGSRDYEEDAFLRLVTSLLGVSDKDSGIARQRAAQE
jgi:uncharacterized tellurite resistance protein B-like protein